MALTPTSLRQKWLGYGLAQWTFWSRKQALLDFAKTAGKSIGDMTMQLDFL
jgi:long-subunit fatty acid transport protein